MHVCVCMPLHVCSKGQPLLVISESPATSLRVTDSKVTGQTPTYVGLPMLGSQVFTTMPIIDTEF